MNMYNRFGKAALLAATGLAVSVMASAASAETFNFASGGSASPGTYGNVWTFTGTGGTKVEVSGFSLSGTDMDNGWVQQYTPYGLGLTNGPNDDSHTIDNSGRVDMLVLQFDHIVNVSDLSLTAWGDTDITYSIGATIVPFAGTLSIPNKAALDALFGTYTASNGSTLSDGTSFTRSVNPGDLTGNLFLVSASMTGGSNDKVKLKGLTETVVSVPEPATWAMMIGGLGLVGSSMRRRKTAVSFA